MRHRAITHHQLGFSLTELLVTLSIIAILSVFLLPAIQNSLEASRQTKCASNLRQIGMGLFNYASDNSGRLPPTSAVYPTADEKDAWGHAIWTYVGYAESSFNYPRNDLGVRTGAKQDNIFRCPSTWIKSTANPSVGSVNSNLFSYGLNFSPLVALGFTGELKWTAGIPLASIARSATTVMVTEDSFSRGDWWGYTLYFGLIPHQGGSNFLFFDGHVQYFRPSDIPTKESDPFWGGI